MPHLRKWLQEIDDYEFEEFVAELWGKMGWKTAVTEGSGDRGIDVIATKGEPFETKQLIQAKRYSEGSTVGSPQIQQYASLRQQEPNVDAVVVVTTSMFSKQAEKIANDLNVKLIDGVALENLVEKYECQELVLRYADPSAATSGQLDSAAVKTNNTALETATDFAANIDTEDENRSKYGSRTIHTVIAVLTVWWTLGLGNVAYAAWSYHKAKYASGVPDEYEVNASDNWYYGVVIAVLAGGAVFTIGMPLSGIIPGVIDPLMGFILLITWVLLPVSLYYDIQYVRGKSDWNPVTGLWLIGAVLLVINVVVGLLYLMRRKNKMGHDRFSALVRRKIAEKGQAENGPSGPMGDIKKQYIEGKIDEEEFNRKLERLLETGGRKERDDITDVDLQTDRD